MATKKPKAAKVSATQSYLLDALAEAEKVAGIQRVVVGLEERISTGLLSLDLILGRGGLAPGMYTFAGGEQSAKTTTQLVAMAASVDQNVSLRILVDAEGSSGSSTDYVQNIVDTVRGVNKPKIAVEDLFGALDNKGNYTKPPIVVYKDDNSLEPILNFLAALFRRLPDKRFEDGAWWYIFDNDKVGQKLAQRMGVEIDAGRSKLTGKLMALAPDGSPQAMILIDGWAALLPIDLDEDGGKAGLGLVARKFAENLPKVKGKVRAKRIIIIGTNQIKEKPMVMFGDSRYESGGNSLKYLSDVRIWHTARAISAAPYPVPKTNIEKGNIEVEDSVEFPGQKDAYRYVHLVAKKNKLGVPNRETFMRIWISDGEMKGRGIDPVFDLFHVLMQTNQASGKRSSIKLNIKSLGEATKSISWSEFKILVLGTIEERNAILRKIGYREGIDLRSGLTKMSKNGIIEKLYLEARGGGKAEKIENSDDGDIPEDDDSEDLED